MQKLRQQLKAQEENLLNVQVELEEARKAIVCAKCKSEPRDTVTVPCMHLMCCSKCVVELSSCFVCNREVEGFLRCNISE